MTFIYAIILFVVLIFPHELGHFIVAKAVGIKVSEFSFGMGPAIYKKQGAETLYSIRVIPIGGYCAMENENEESDNERDFNNKPVWAKIAVLLAGSVMNVLIAVIVLSVMMGYAGTGTTTIDKVSPDSPAYEVGIEKGDIIKSVNGTETKTWNDMTALIGRTPDKMTIVLERDGIKKEVRVVPQKNEEGRYVIGITPVISHNPVRAVKAGAKISWSLTTSMYDSLVMLIKGRVSKDEIAGPVGMVTLVSKTSQYGLWYFGYLLALISLNLAIINMLPLPALDGGRILFVIIRKITGRMISDQLESRIHAAGLILLFGLMIFVTWNDIGRLIS